jgi:putative hemolysin
MTGFLIFWLIFLLVLFGFFSAAESSFNRIGNFEVSQIRSKASKSLLAILKNWEENPETYKFSIAVSMIVTISLAMSNIVSIGVIQSHPDHLPRWTGLSVAMFFLLGHVLPKAYARKFPVKVFAPALLGTSFLLFLGRPFTKLFSSQILRRKIADRSESSSEDRLEFMVSEGQLSGLIGDIKKDIIEGAFEIDDTKVREIMTPRRDMIAIHADFNVAEIKKVFVESGHSRLPVYREDLDDIIGVVIAKDIMRLDIEGKSSSARAMDIQREVIFAPESRHLADVFKDLKKARSHLAIIVDEFGGTSGLVTMEDILEEIVGEIQDEHDLEEAGISELSPTTFEVKGWVNIDEFLEFFKMSEEEIVESKRPKNVDTLAGWITQLTQEIPQAGQSVSVGHVQIEILHTDRRRIEKVKVSMAPNTQLEPQSLSKG